MNNAGSAYIVAAASPSWIAQKVVDPFYTGRQSIQFCRVSDCFCIESDFVDVILLTYTYFSSAAELLRSMTALYLAQFIIFFQNNIDNNNIQQRFSRCFRATSNKIQAQVSLHTFCVSTFSYYLYRILYVINLWLQRHLLRLVGDKDFLFALSDFTTTTQAGPAEKPFLSFLQQWLRVSVHDCWIFVFILIPLLRKTTLHMPP